MAILKRVVPKKYLNAIFDGNTSQLTPEEVATWQEYEKALSKEGAISLVPNDYQNIGHSEINDLDDSQGTCYQLSYSAVNIEDF